MDDLEIKFSLVLMKFIKQQNSTEYFVDAFDSYGAESFIYLVIVCGDENKTAIDTDLRSHRPDFKSTVVDRMR